MVTIDRRTHLYITERMETVGLSDQDVADKLSVARETVTRWRKHQSRLNPGKIARLASVLDCEPEELWRLPPPAGRPSLDAMVKHAPPELQDTAADIVKRLVDGRRPEPPEK